MNFRATAIAIVLSLASAARPLPAQAAARPTPIALWPSGAPGALGHDSVDIPTISVYRPTIAVSTGAAMIICPGGSYENLADHEGHAIAVWLNTLGVTGVVLKYRLGPRYHHPAPLQDVARAIRAVRAHAVEWHLDPARVGVIGFSAGGHLASTIATHFDAGDPAASDPVDRLSSRPDIAVLAYPVISMDPTITHAVSRQNVLGPNPSDALVTLLSNEKQVTAATPPTFIFHTIDDPVVPVENSRRFAAALAQAHVPYELHLYAHGPHGVGLATDDSVLSTWTALLANWLRSRGFLDHQSISAVVDSIPAHQSFSLQSQVLGEPRLINVHLPASYNAALRYPVLYMPDGGIDEDFPHVVQMVDSLTAHGLIRPVIVVGIPNTERRRDLTGPTRIKSDSEIAPHVGGSAAFRRFIRDELIPEVDRRYRTTTERSIIGESLAGLFIMEAFLEEPALFTHYVALDPSLWWNNGALVTAAPRLVARFPAGARSLYFASSKEPTTAVGSAKISALLKTRALPALRWSYHPRPDLEHGNIYLTLERDALLDALGKQ